MSTLLEEIKQPKNYIVLAFGVLLGAGLMGYVASYAYRHNMNLLNKNSAAQDGKAVPEVQVSKEYMEAVKNPTMPFTDAQGVEHPPLGNPALVVPTADLKAPPIGGAATASPKATTTKKK